MPRIALADVGYAHYAPNLECMAPGDDLAEIRSEFSRLERDEHAPPGVNRFRRYGNGVVLPWSEERVPHWLPVVKDRHGRGRALYGQGSFNPDHASTRSFPALSEAVKRNQLLLSLIRDDFSHTFWTSFGQPFPIYFGVHFIKLTSAGPDDPGISSPDCFHQDGEPFTFAHLIYRSPNTEGGVNYIGHTALRNVPLETAGREQILAEFTLSSPLDSFAVHDPRVTHYVSPITRRDNAGPDVCERCVVLIDFSSTVQDI